MTSNQLNISTFILEEKLFDGNIIQSFFNFKRNKYLVLVGNNTRPHL